MRSLLARLVRHGSKGRQINPKARGPVVGRVRPAPGGTGIIAVVGSGFWELGGRSRVEGYRFEERSRTDASTRPACN
jgi:hypothetical protein